MSTSKLNELKSIDDVARACGVEVEFVRAYAESNEQRSYYDVLKLRKKGKRRNREFRIVFSAREERLKQLHRGLSMIVVNSTKFEKHVQGFVKKRSTFTNARQHLGAQVLLHADIKGFFDAITTEHVRIALIEHGMLGSIAELIAKACTIDGLLRQGTRCSPTIANLVCFDMDQAFIRLAEAFGSKYTRYADDICFSGDTVPPDDSVRTLLRNCGFELRDGHCIKQYRGRVQFVTGLSVADPLTPRLPKRLKRQLRLVMYFIKKYGIDGHFDRSRQERTGPHVTWLDGILKYAQSIEPTPVKKWQLVLDKARLDQEKSRLASSI